MRRVALVVAGALALAVTQLTGLATAQDEPLCGPPEQEVPATIVGSGTIVGTAGDDVIVGSEGNDTTKILLEREKQGGQDGAGTDDDAADDDDESGK